ncbi:D-aminoacylase [Chelatococcus sp. SYSU_G07232]|uniref:D-aminoacylase n=1 Tax=Chelatococcus albus TaxID=3047466 RepID=A0ABT7AKT2_9HYPH|nr:D-aminoacylase [Chelatococcus sp. SYSU_G07232]MDJ1159968.1 D-aminoacylase [Chelatococcus sp. SYSU_G07232]
MSPPRYDLVLRNALVIDGTGAAPYRGEVALAGDRIALVGAAGLVAPGDAARELDIAGRAVSPGFIDAHTHDDRIVLDAPDMLPKVSQGVTTVVAGNCGISLAPVTFAGEPPPPMNLLGGRKAYAFPRFANYAAAVRETTPGVNVAALVGHSALRLATMDDVSRKASEREIGAMRDLADEAMENGAIGFSSGLFYLTNKAADADEVVAVAARFAEHGGVYATHMRDEFDNVVDSLAETFLTAERAHIPVVVSHHKCAGPRNWGRTQETLPLIAAAAGRHPVSLDAYPYEAGSTVLREDLVTDEYRIMIAWSAPHPEVTGLDLTDIATAWGLGLPETARRLQPAGAIYFQMDEADVRRVLAFPLTMIGSDGLPHDRHPHPRLWGTFPRVLGRYARELGLFPLETAVHKMTGMPAKTFRLAGRGRIAPGFFADLVVFDPETVADRATYEKPTEMSAGIEHVFVNGRLSWSAGETTVKRAGRLIGGRA